MCRSSTSSFLCNTISSLELCCLSSPSAEWKIQGTSNGNRADLHTLFLLTKESHISRQETQNPPESFSHVLSPCDIYLSTQKIRYSERAGALTALQALKTRFKHTKKDKKCSSEWFSTTNAIHDLVFYVYSRSQSVSLVPWNTNFMPLCH